MVDDGQPGLIFRVAIPARYHSSRLPGKLLREIGGVPMIEHVHRRALESGARSVIVATDDRRIQRVCERFGAQVCLTDSQHQSGTDRIAEAAHALGWAEDEIVVNLQGDEPLMPPNLVRQVAEGLMNHKDAGIATLSTSILESRELFDPHVVKVVTDHQGYALYFSRAPVPWHREEFATAPDRLPTGGVFKRHLGIYAYRAGVLNGYASLPDSMLEQAESLEQLRALDAGVRIYVDVAEASPPPGVDTEADLIRVNAALCGKGR